MQDFLELVKLKNAQGKLKYGMWADIPKEDQVEAITLEFGEWIKSLVLHDINGEHGEINELADLVNVCIRRAMYLTGEPDA